jgi:hypothetical protein
MPIEQEPLGLAATAWEKENSGWAALSMTANALKANIMLNCVDYFFYFLYLWTPVVFFWF